MSVAADLPSGRNAFPSRNSSASNFPGPQLDSTVRTVPSSTPSSLLKRVILQRTEPEPQALPFPAVRCDRVVKAVLERIGARA